MGPPFLFPYPSSFRLPTSDMLHVHSFRWVRRSGGGQYRPWPRYKVQRSKHCLVAGIYYNTVASCVARQSVRGVKSAGQSERRNEESTGVPLYTTTSTPPPLPRIFGSRSWTRRTPDDRGRKLHCSRTTHISSYRARRWRGVCYGIS